MQLVCCESDNHVIVFPSAYSPHNCNEAAEGQLRVYIIDVEVEESHGCSFHPSSTPTQTDCKIWMRLLSETTTVSHHYCVCVHVLGREKGRVRAFEG